jgi:hypothetical protein
MAVALSCLGIIALCLAISALGGFIVMLLWNFAVVGIVAACGGKVATIGFWLAWGVSIGLGVIANLFRPSSK